MANPFDLTLSGAPAAMVTRGYHLSAATTCRRCHLGFLPPDESSIEVAEQAGVYR